MTGTPKAVISAKDRQALSRLLGSVSRSQLTAVAGDLFEVAQFPVDFPWRDPAAVVDLIAGMPARPHGVPALLAFADRVAAELSGALAADIDRWVDAVAEAAGLDRVTFRSSSPAPPHARDAPNRQVVMELEDPLHDEPQQIPSRNQTGVVTVTGRSPSDVLKSTGAQETEGEPIRIWGGVPLRNPAFTGRETLLLSLQRALERRSKASVLPHALHGLGGVGKTQLAVEFAYRYAERYDIVWWIPAEHQSLVLQSLYQLGQSLGLTDTADLKQAASLVLDELAGTSLNWLLIYDNANEPEEIARLMPARGGHVVLTSRSTTWSEVWDPIEVDTFDRSESIELVRKRSESVSPEDADLLAARLGDLPLALDQAASCQAATGLPVAEFLSELDRHMRDLAKPNVPSYRTTIAALVRLAVWRLRTSAPAVAELLEMFAYLGAEPISGGLLRTGKAASVSAALGRALRDQIAWNRAIRDLRRYGLAKVDPDQRIQVHRLFQGVLRDELTEDAAQRGRHNVQHLLASANPGDPDDEDTWSAHGELGPHIGPAGLLDSELLDARRVVLDQVRYLLQIGDLEGSRRLGEAALEAWSKVEGREGLGPSGELTLRVAGHLANALRSLGFNDRARSLIEDAFDRFVASPDFGPDHEYTLMAASGLGPNLRVAGLFREALEVDRDNLARHLRVFGDEDEATLRARRNLAVNLRMLSDFDRAYEIDAEVVRVWQQTVSENDNRLLFAQTNLARDLYGLGRYTEALALLQKALPPYRQQLGAGHNYVLLAGRTLAISLRKVGRYEDALGVAAEHHRDSVSRYGPQHEHALVAAMTHANTLRVNGRLSEAHDLATATMDRYSRAFGEAHPLVLAAAVNYTIVLRGLGEDARARELDERTYERMREVLGDEHGYTLCAASNLAGGLAAAGEAEAARRLSTATLETSRRARGERHPYTLVSAVNCLIDMIAVEGAEEGQALLDAAATALGEVLGPAHPETLLARDGRRIECDIEPPPT